MLKYSKNGKWKPIWGQSPFSEGAVALGTVTVDNGSGAEPTTGALIHLAAGGYFLGTQGELKEISQKDILEALERSRAAGSLGRVGGKSSSPAKVAAAKENARLNPGRPRKVVAKAKVPDGDA